MAPTSSASVFSSARFNSSSLSVSRPTTRDSTIDAHTAAAGSSSAVHNSNSIHSSGVAAAVAPKERKTGFTRKSSRRGTWTSAAAHSSSSSAAAGTGSAAHNDNSSSLNIVTDATAPPALPEYALSAAAKVVHREKEKIKERLREREKEKSRERERDRDREREKEREKEIKRRERDKERDKERDRGREAATDGALSPTSPQEPTNLLMARLQAAAMGSQLGPHWESNSHLEAGMAFHEISELAKKRISTLQYLRKAHGEGRIYWFNTYLFDRPDFNRMPTFDPRKLGRKATCYFLLGISIPTISDLYASTPVEFLRCLNGLLSEFDTFTQLHGDGPPSAASLTRARLPSMFRRPTAKTRRSGSTSAAGGNTSDIIEEGSTSFSSSVFSSYGGGGGSSSGSVSGGGSGGGNNGSSAGGAVMTFATAESELLPGEEYAYLLTPSLPFDPDFYETFATLCDALIDCYTRFLALVPTQAEATASVAELFTKADGKMRKIMVQGVVRDFEEHSRTNAKNELASISKVVLSGLI